MPFLPIEELQRRAKLASKIAKTEAKLNGVYVPYMESGRLIREYPDGRKVYVSESNGLTEEIPVA